MTWLRVKTFNFFMIYAKDHVFQSTFADMSMACSSSLKIFDKNAKDVTSTKLSEGTMLKCPSLNRESSGDFQS